MSASCTSARAVVSASPTADAHKNSGSAAVENHQEAVLAQLAPLAPQNDADLHLGTN
jgi:hypothetical protein